MNNKTNYFWGTACIVLGLGILFLSLGTLIIRVLIGLAAVKLVDYGLSLQRKGSLKSYFFMYAARRCFW